MSDDVSKMDFKISYPGERRSEPIGRMITLEGVKNWIRSHQFDTYTTEGLIQIASKYPQQALPSFKKNFTLLLSRVRQKRKKELGEDSPQGASNEKQEANVQNISGNFDEAFNNFVKTEITENSQQKPEVKEEETDVEKIWLPNEFDES